MYNATYNSSILVSTYSVDADTVDLRGY